MKTEKRLNEIRQSLRDENISYGGVYVPRT